MTPPTPPPAAGVSVRVLHVIPTLDPQAGGLPMALLGLAKAQARSGVGVAACATWRRGHDLRLADDMRRAGAHVELVGPTSGPLMRHPDLRHRLRALAGEADVLHIHGVWEEIQHAAARAARAAAIPYVVTPHGMLDPWSLAQKRLKKRLYLSARARRDLNGAAVIHCTSDVEARLLAPLRLRPPTLVVPSGLDLGEFEDLPPRDAFRNMFAAVRGRRIVLFLSRLHPKKGLELLIPAFARACVNDDSVLVLAGPDADGYRATLEALARQHGIAERVVFTGMLHGADRIKALAAAELYVLPSYQENFGIAVVESLAAGTPVVISDQVNIHGQITAGGVGAVVPTAVEPLAAAIGRWMGDDELRRASAARARDFARRFDWASIAATWHRQYARLAAKPQGRPPKLAIVCNSLPPYRVHLHRRIAAELRGVELWTLCTHEGTSQEWAFDPPPEINPVRFGPGEPSSQQGRTRYAAHEWRKGGRVIRWIRDNRPAVVLVNGYNDAGRLRVIHWCRRHDVPVLLWGDSNVLGDHAAGAKLVLKRAVLGAIVRRCAALLPCGSLGRRYFERYGAPPDRIFYFPVEPDYDLIRDLPPDEVEQTRERHGLAAGRRRIVFSGRLVDVKRADVALDAFAAIADERPDWDLLVVGDGPLRGDLQARLPERLRDRVTWTGFVGDQRQVTALYRLSDVLVLPSDYEPWALVVNEAAAAGLAIVCSNVVGAAAELVGDGENGRLVPPGDADAFADALRDVTRADRIDAYRQASSRVLRDWRARGDPVAGLVKALERVGVLRPSSAPMRESSEGSPAPGRQP